jgi:lysozyme family protein
MIIALAIGMVFGAFNNSLCRLNNGIGSIICPESTLSVFAKSSDLIAKLNQNLPTYQKISQATGVPWEFLAAIHYRETNMNTNQGRGSGGSGPMQFIDSTWRQYATDGNGDGVADILSFEDSVATAAKYLDALRGGHFSSGNYTDEDIKLASLYYNRGTASAYGSNYNIHPYTMNNLDIAHHGMVWPSNDGYIGGKDARDGVYTVYALLKTAKFNDDGTVDSVGDCSVIGRLLLQPGKVAANLLSIAGSYIGRLTHYSQPNRTDFDNGYADCSSFVSKILQDMGLDVPIMATGGMAARWDGGTDPDVKPLFLPHRTLTSAEMAQVQPGDIIIWGNAYSTNDAHTAIIDKIENDTFYYTDMTGGGGGVQHRSRPRTPRSVWGVYRVIATSGEE